MCPFTCFCSASYKFFRPKIMNKEILANSRKSHGDFGFELLKFDRLLFHTEGKFSSAEKSLVKVVRDIHANLSMYHRIISLVFFMNDKR